MGRRTLLLITAILIAAVGTALVAIYVRGADQRAEQGANLVTVLVATRTVQANDSVQNALDSSSFGTQRVLQRERGDDVLTSLTQLQALASQGEVAVGPILQGQVIQRAMFNKSGAAVDTALEPDRMRMAVQMADPNRSAGFLVQGSQVAVFATIGEGDQQRTALVIPKVKVLSVGAASSAAAATERTSSTQGNGNGNDTSAAEDTVPTTIVSLSVDQAEAQKLIFATKAGELYFAILGSKANPNPAQPPTTLSSLLP